MPKKEPAVPAPPMSNRDIIKQEVRTEIKRQNRLRMLRSCGCSLLTFVIIFVLPAYLLAAAVAKTGLVEIPVMTNWLYHPAAYTRLVAPLANVTSDQILKNVETTAVIDRAASTVSMTLTEGQVTALLMSSLKNSGDSLPFKISKVQTAILPGSLELYAEIPRPERTVTAVIRLAPAIVKGQVNLEIQRIQIGSFVAPKSLTDMLGPSLSAQLNNLLTQNAQQAGEITDIVLAEGKMTIKIHVKTK